MAEELRHITRQEVTDALFWTNGDHGQSNINNDADPEGRSDTWTYKNDDASLLYYMANQFSWDGAAVAYCANDFGEVTLHDDLLVSEYMKRSGGTDDYIRMENDKISIAAGGTTAFTFEDDKVYTSLDTGIGTSTPGVVLDVRDASVNTEIQDWYANSVKIGVLQTNADGDGALILRNVTPTTTILLNSDGDSYLNGGDVGVGTTTPATKFEVRKDQNSDTTVRITNDTGGTSSIARCQVASNSSVGAIIAVDDGYTDITEWTDKVVVDADATTTALLLSSRNASGEVQVYVGGVAAGNKKAAFQTGGLLMLDKIMFTQTDGNEAIDSLADGYMDYLATTGHRFNQNITVTKNQASDTTISIVNSDASGSCVLELDTVGGGNTAQFRSDDGNDMTELAFAHSELRIRDRGTTPYIEITPSTNDYKINTAGASAGSLIFGAGGSDVVTVSSDDFYTTGWTDYSGTSTIVGWAASPTAVIDYKKIGKLVFCKFDITGTSNSTAASFTLPYGITNTGQKIMAAIAGYDNGADLDNGASAWMSFNSQLVCECAPDQGHTPNVSGWTNVNGKRVCGQFWFETSD